MNTQTSTSSKTLRAKWVFPLVCFLVLGFFGFRMFSSAENGAVLAETDEAAEQNTTPYVFRLHIPTEINDLARLSSLIVTNGSVFEGKAEFLDELILQSDLNVGESLGVGGNGTIDGDLTVRGKLRLSTDLSGSNVNIDVGTGKITAGSLATGDITGGNLNVGNIDAGDITADKVTASNLVYSVKAGSGISVSGGQDVTISATDLGSSQKIFKNVKVNDDTITAGSNDDTLILKNGSGVSLTRSGNEISFTGENLSGWAKSGTYVSLIDASNSVGIGTASPSNKLEVNSGSTDTSGLTFTQLTSASTVGIGGGKVLSVDSGGRVILVQDQTGDTPTAESVLPTATNGQTLYFNGLNWVASDNLYHNGGQVGISTAPGANTRLHVLTNANSTVGLVVQRVSGQTANLQEFRNESGTNLTYFDSDGVFHGDVTGNVTGNINGTINAGLSTGQVAFQGASGLTGSNALFWDAGNARLGIGTTSPSTPLHVVGQALATTGFVTNNNSGIQVDTNNALVLSATNAFLKGSENIYLSIDANNDSTTASFVIQNNSTTAGAGTNLFTVQEDGDVGIGVSSPTQKLEVAGNIGFDTADRSIYRGAVERLQLTAVYTNILNANVGIGTTSPGAMLTVAGDLSAATATISANYAAGKGLVIKGGPSGSGNLLELQNSGGTVLSSLTASGGFVYQGSYASNILNLNGGTMLLGTSSSAGFHGLISAYSDLRLSSSNGGTGNILLTPGNAARSVVVRGAASQTGNLQEWQNSSGTVLSVINKDGSMGIGTSTVGSPYELDVNGDARFTATGIYLNVGNNYGLNFAGIGNIYRVNNSDLAISMNNVEAARFTLAGNFGLGATTFGTGAQKVFAIAGSTAPSTAITDGAQLFAVDQAGSHELRVMDEAGNITTLSPHNFSLIPEGRSEDLAWSFYSERNGLAINADMTRALRLVEKLSGEQLIYLKDLDTNQDIAANFSQDLPTTQTLLETGNIPTVAKWSYNLWTFISEVVFEKPVKFLAEVIFHKPVQFLSGIFVKGNTTLEGDLNVNGRTQFTDQDMGGEVIIKTGDIEVKITFVRAFTQVPVVTATPANPNLKIGVKDKTLQGFTLVLSSAATQDEVINWVALPLTNAGRTQSPGQASPAPASESQTTSPTPSSTAVPTTNPSASPEPTVSATATPSASPAVTPTPEASTAPSSTPEPTAAPASESPSPSPTSVESSTN